MASSCRRGGQFALIFMMGRQLLPVLVLTIALVGQAFGATSESTKTSVERLVTAAAQAEISGDVSKSLSLLQDAIRIDPENQLVRWQLGQVKADKQWVTVDEAQRRASADPLQAEYHQRRTAAGDNSQAQLVLAKWCRKKDLTDEALFHWASVLAVDPKNDEALRALDLHWQNGQLMTSVQMADYKDQLRESKRAAERWAPKIVKWRRSVSGRDAAAREAALDEISRISEADSIYPIEQITLGRDARDPHHADECLQIGLAFLKSLGKMTGQPATESLARHAVFAPDDAERAVAVEQLKVRDQHDYVPMLLGALSMPIESTFSVRTDGSGDVHYAHSLYREGADADWSADSNYYSMQHALSGHNLLYRRKRKVLEDHGPAVPVATMMRDSHNSQLRYGLTAAAVETRIANANQASEALNARIIPVLTATTGKEFDSPRQWWDYWRENNEYYAYDHPVDYRYYSGTDDRFYGKPYDTVATNPSCFVKGTPVWTKTGRRPIESLELGDLVLAQDVNTGELKYSPIIGRTVRPPSPIVKLSIDKEQVRTTRGHLFWVAGTGWRMAKELEKGAKLHGLKGSLEIASADSDGEAEAYNLVVADLDTYFVGDQGLLVHDNTPRSPTRAILPGILRAK
jgi:tetratricopeptide (TPR) repeat protein